MTDGGSGDGSNQSSTAVSTKEKVGRNKRKSTSQVPTDVPFDPSPMTLTEFPRYGLLKEKLQKEVKTGLGLLEVISDGLAGEEEVEGLGTSNWDDPMASQLEELLSDNVRATFRGAIMKLVRCGYSEEVAEDAVMRNGLFYGKDPVLNTMEGALLYLTQEREYNTPRCHVFSDFEKLVEYTVLEMVYVLREVKPFLTVPDAMWWLLVFDMNLSVACAVEGDYLGDILSGFCHTVLDSTESTLSKSNNPNISETSIPSTQNSRPEVPLVGGVPNLPRVKKFLVHGATTSGKQSSASVAGSGGKTLSVEETMTQILSMEEKSVGGSKKGRSGNSKRDMLRQKSLHFEKAHKGVTKGLIRGKLGGLGGLILDKKSKSQTDSSVVNIKMTSSKTGTATDMPLGGTFSALTATHTKISASVVSETKRIPKPQTSMPSSAKLTDQYYARIPYDKSLGKYVPRDEKDEEILALVPRFEGLQKELEQWTCWANKRVMEAAQRLGVEQSELKALRKEKEEAEKSEKEKQILEDNTNKRLSELEYAIANASGQVEMANSTARRLEVDCASLKIEMETKKQEAIKSAADLQEALLREQEAVKKAQSGEVEKSLLQEEVTSLKQKVAKLQKEVERARGVYNQIQGRLKWEQREVEKLELQANSIRREREGLEALLNGEEDVIRQEADNKLQRFEEDIEKLESELSVLRLESESSTIEALKRGINGNYPSRLTDQKSAAYLNSKTLEFTRDYSGLASVRQERECVMCLMEEMSVVFLPCAHQVLCTECNELHEKQGMNDCPSCRTPIMRRVAVLFVSHHHHRGRRGY